jgi:DNA polymerase V
MGVPLFKVRDIVEENGVAVFSSNYALYGDLSLRLADAF